MFLLKYKYISIVSKLYFTMRNNLIQSFIPILLSMH